jgi:hypothetical protein
MVGSFVPPLVKDDKLYSNRRSNGVYPERVNGLKVTYKLHAGLVNTHPEFAPPDNTVKIWRYFDFAKFISMLDKRALFFSRADKLGDPFEGSYSKETVRSRSRDERQISDMLKQIPRFTIINCWSISESESASLWALYSRTGQGIAIQSTVGRLKMCLGVEEDQNKSHIGAYIYKVKYIDFQNDIMPDHFLLSPFLHKRKSFEHENELRAIIMQWPPKIYDKILKMKGIPYEEVVKAGEIFNQGEYVDVDLERLIENVYVSPLSPNWFRCLVDSVLEKYALNLKALSSNLDDCPVY